MQLASVKDLIVQAEKLKLQIPEVEQLEKECQNAKIEDNEFTVLTCHDLSFDLDILTDSLIKQSNFIENQIILGGKTNITPEKIQVFTETFNLCDKDKSNSLNRIEFKNALLAEGKSDEGDDEKYEKLFISVSKGSDEISYSQVIYSNIVY